MTVRPDGKTIRLLHRSVLVVVVVHDLEVIWVMPREKDSEIPFLSRRMHGTVYTLEAVKTVFMDLFCTPKSSKEKPSLEDYSEDE